MASTVNCISSKEGSEEGEQSWLKPKWMRWRTFERICGQLDAADEAWGSLVFVRLAPLLLRGD
jgi:hypothetical protein